jgi:hypothetical protein
MKKKIKPQAAKPFDVAAENEAFEAGRRKDTTKAKPSKQDISDGLIKREPSPLPWHVYDDGNAEQSSDIILASIDGDNYDVCEMNQDRPVMERKANAALIVRCVNAHAGLVEALTALANVAGERGMDRVVISGLVADARAALRAQEKSVEGLVEAADCCNRSDKKQNHAPGCPVEVVWEKEWRKQLGELRQANCIINASEEPLSWAQAALTALNVGDVKSGSPLHLKLREVMIAYRAALAAVREAKGKI